VIGGDVPFYELCLLGQYQDSRGYQTGQYRDRVMLTAQAEYRLELWKKGSQHRRGLLNQVSRAPS